MSHLEEHELRCVRDEGHDGLHACLWPESTGPTAVHWLTGDSRLVCQRDDGERQ